MIKNSDFSNVALDKVTPITGSWQLIAPSQVLIGDDWLSIAGTDYSFNDYSQIFNGSNNYRIVEITMKGKANISDMLVELVEVPGYDTEETIQTCSFVCSLGTIDLIENETTMCQFNLPPLDQNKKYVVAIFSQSNYYYLVGSNDLGDNAHAYTMYRTLSGDNFVYKIEKYSSDYNGRGSYIYSYFQQKFK